MSEEDPRNVRYELVEGDLPGIVLTPEGMLTGTIIPDAAHWNPLKNCWEYNFLVRAHTTSGDPMETETPVNLKIREEENALEAITTHSREEHEGKEEEREREERKEGDA